MYTFFIFRQNIMTQKLLQMSLYEQDTMKGQKENISNTPAELHLVKLREYIPDAEIGKEFDYTDLDGSKRTATLKKDGAILSDSTYLDFNFFLQRYFIKPAQEKLAADRKAREQARMAEENARMAPIREAEAQAAKLAAEEAARLASIADTQARFPEKKEPQEGIESHFNDNFNTYLTELDQYLAGFTRQTIAMDAFGDGDIIGRQYSSGGKTITAFEASKNSMFVIVSKVGLPQSLQIHITANGTITNSISSSFGWGIVPNDVTTQAEREQYYVTKINEAKTNEKILGTQNGVSGIIQKFLEQYH